MGRSADEWNRYLNNEDAPPPVPAPRSRLRSSTRTELTPLGWLGALLMVGSPVAAGALQIETTRQLATSITRTTNGLGLSRGPDVSFLQFAVYLALAVGLLGLVWVLVGRRHITAGLSEAEER